MRKYHDINNLKCEDGFLVITIAGEPKKFLLKKISPALEKASEEERNNFEISPAGYGINWSLLNEDISIDGLLGIVHVPRWKKEVA